MRTSYITSKASIARLKNLFVVVMLLLILVFMASCTDIKAMRKEAVNRQRRVIYNNDGCDALYFPNSLEPTPENFLARRTSPLLGSNVDTISYCTISSGFSNFTHNTKVGNVLTAQPPPSLVPNTRNITQDLIDQGTDALQVMVDFCRKNDMEIFWSMRMNDTHDQAHRPDKPHFLFPPLKVQHPEYLIGTFKNQPIYGSYTSVNYALPEIRDMAFKFIEEICQNYDIDGIELDYFRHLSYFKSVAYGGKATQAELDMMTDLMRRVRKMANQIGIRRGKPILIAVRVPDSVEYSRAIGLDIERWMADDLVDILITTDYFRLNFWDYTVNLAHKYGVKAYPCITDSRVGGQDKKFKRQSEKSLRARAMTAWAANADGVYTFNHFNPNAQYLREIGDRQQLQKLDKTYFASIVNRGPSDSLANGDELMNLKLLTPINAVNLSPKSPEQIEMVIGDDFSWTENEPVKPEVKCHLRFEGLKSADNVVTSLNGNVLKDGILTGQWLEYNVDPRFVKKGINLVNLFLIPQVSDKTDTTESEVWNMTYDCDKVLVYPASLPWRRLFKPNNWTEEIRDEAFYFADEATGKSEWSALLYPWQISSDGQAVVEARLKVESSTDPLGVCIRVSNGRFVEYLTLEEHSIGLKYAGLAVPMDTASDFHTYRIVTEGKDIKVYVDGELKLDGSGKFMTSALDKTKWIGLVGGWQYLNKNCLLFGSATGPGTGAAYWDHIKFRAKKMSLLDMVMTISYKEK